jgi:hypothetical protein
MVDRKERERELILLAFHLQDAFPNLGRGQIADMMAGPIAELCLISRRLYQLEMIEQGRRLTDKERQTEERNIARAEMLGAEIGCPVCFPPFTGNAGVSLVLPNGARNDGGNEWYLWA